MEPEGIFEELMHHLRESVRKAFGKAISPGIGLIGSGSVRTSHHIDSRKYGMDGGKKAEKNIFLSTRLAYQWQPRFILPISTTV